MASGRNISFRNQLNNGLLALAFVLILGTSAFSVSSTNLLDASIEMVSHSQNAKDLISRAKLALASAEANRIRYLISGNADSQLLHRQAQAELQGINAALAKAIRDNPLQRSYLADFMQRTDSLFARSRELLELKRRALLDGDAYVPVWRISDNKTQVITIEMQKILDKMADEEKRILLVRADERDALVQQANATVLIANALALVAGMLGFVAIRRSQQESEKMLLAEFRAEQARRANEEKSSFLANMSHEIRTPMNAIFGFTQLLSESVVAPIERDWVLSIKKSGQMLLGLINDVLDLSKIEAGKMQLHAQPADVAEIMKESMDLFAPQAHEKGIKLTQEISPALHQPLMLDAQRLRQVLINLLSNAVKYTEQGGIHIGVSILPENDPVLRRLRLSVTDSGVGIHPDQLASIFEPFHQADSPDGKVRQGTGLGLSISRRLIDLMHGTIQVSSELGKGASFLVEIPDLPIAEASPETHEPKVAGVDFNRLPPLTVLVVDDIAWNSEIAAGFLANSHHQVHIANSGLEAVAAAKKLRPDLVLMDLRMPGMSGFEATDAIRSDPDLQGLPLAIVAMTASGLGDDEKALRDSFDGYVRKPYTPTELFVAMNAIFGAKKTQDVALALAPQSWTAADGERWRDLRGPALAQLRASMRMREIGLYAQQLTAFAEQTRFAGLEARGLALLNAVQRFDIQAVTTVLSELAEMPENFDEV